MAWRITEINDTLYRNGGQENELVIWATDDTEIANLPTTASVTDDYGVDSGIPLLGSVCVVIGDGTGLSVYGFDPATVSWVKMNAE